MVLAKEDGLMEVFDELNDINEQAEAKIQELAVHKPYIPLDYYTHHSELLNVGLYQKNGEWGLMMLVMAWIERLKQAIKNEVAEASCVSRLNNH